MREKEKGSNLSFAPLARIWDGWENGGKGLREGSPKETRFGKKWFDTPCNQRMWRIPPRRSKKLFTGAPGVDLLNNCMDLLPDFCRRSFLALIPGYLFLVLYRCLMICGSHLVSIDFHCLLHFVFLFGPNVST